MATRYASGLHDHRNRGGAFWPRKRFLLAGLAALGLSVAAHWIAYLTLDLDTKELVTGDKRQEVEIKMLPPPSIDRETFVKEFAAEGQRQAAATPAAPPPPSRRSIDSALAATPDPAAEDIDLNPAPSDASPSNDAAPSAWQPPPLDHRESILAIHEKLFEDNLLITPRTIEPEIKRIAYAPDITFPTRLPDGPTDEDLADPDLLPGADADATWSPSEPDVPGSGDITAVLPPSLSELLPEPDFDVALVAAALSERPDLFPPAASSAPSANAPGAAQEAAAQAAASRIAEFQTPKAVEQLLDLRVTTTQTASETFFKIDITRAGIEALPVLPTATVFLQDCSKSIGAAKLETFKSGLKGWLRVLPDGSLFNIITFSDQAEPFSNKLERMAGFTAQRANRFIQTLQPTGRTDVFSSLQTLHQFARTSPVPVIGVILTDGNPTAGERDDAKIIEQFTRLNDGKVSIFCVAGGARANRYLLDLISYRNRGDAKVTRQETGIQTQMGGLAREISRPVLANLSYQIAGNTTAEVYPNVLTHLYLDRPLSLYGRVPRGQETLTLRIEGTSTEGGRDMVFPLNLAAGKPGHDEVVREWAWHKMYDLIGSYTQSNDPATLRQIRQLGIEHGLQVPYLYESRGGGLRQ